VHAHVLDQASAPRGERFLHTLLGHAIATLLMWHLLHTLYGWQSLTAVPKLSLL
jgi:hypothetical protein